MPADVRVDPDVVELDAGHDRGLDAHVDQAMPDSRLDAHADAALDSQPPDAAADRSVRDTGCGVETCSDRDDDCDGRIDEGAACAPTFAQACRVAIAWAPSGVEPMCAPGRCTDSAGDGLFYALPVDRPVAAPHALWVRLTCPERPEWAQICQVAIGRDGAAPVVGAPAACPVVSADDAADTRCVRTGGDGWRSLMMPAAPADADDHYAVAFWCVDPERPDRAAGLTAHVRVWLNTHYRRREGEACLDEPLFDGAMAFGNCPGAAVDDEGRHRCASSRADGAFQGFSFGKGAEDGRVFERCSAFGVALTTR